MEKTKQFRFTPGTHVIAAFATALKELISRGGVEARNKRYTTNQQTLKKHLDDMGFKTFLRDEI
jgi:2-aminoethylphosphonate-pyruvate transaminase